MEKYVATRLASAGNHVASRSFKIGVPAVAVAVVASLGMASAASAAAPAPKQNFKTMRGVCGMVTPDATVPTTYILQNDIGPCKSDGLRIKGNDITVDLNGHNIKGTPLVPDGPDPGTAADGGFGEGVGIRMVGNKRVTITNSKSATTPSTISDFDSGLVIQGGTGTSIQPATGNVVKNIVFFRNEGSQPFQGSGGCDVADPTAICDFSDFNDGLALIHADSNTIGPNNTFEANGVGGIRLDDAASNNTITGNTTRNNLGSGIRLLTNVTGNLLTNNQIINNKDMGIRFAFNNTDNTIRANTISGNAGKGIRVALGSERTVIDANTFTSNGGGGIELVSGSDSVTGNTLTNNGRGPTASPAGKGDGIKMIAGSNAFPRAIDTTVSGNTVTGSGGNGIRATCLLDQDMDTFQVFGCLNSGTRELVSNNTATGNAVNGPAGALVLSGGPSKQVIGWFDLLDSTNTLAAQSPNSAPLTDCGDNTWKGNTATTAFPACTLAP